MALRGADPSLWFNMPCVIAAYQPVAAPDALSARQNMALGGRGWYAAAPGTAPTWGSNTGWIFNGSSQYLTTGVNPASYYSMIVRFANTTNNQFVCGRRVSALSNEFSLLPNSATATREYRFGTYRIQKTAITSGVMAICGDGVFDGFYDGVSEGGFAATTLSNNITINIGGINNNGTPTYFAGNVLALSIYARALLPAEVWLASRQMAYCESNPAWSVWAPARRWFFVPPPPAAVATPVLSTIYINSADIGDTSLFDDVSGAAVSASYARTGTNSFKLDGSDYLQADLTSSATKHTKFGLLVTDTPASDALLVAWQETGTEHVSLYLTDKLTLQMRQGSTIIQTSPTTLEINTWYCIETKIVVHDTIGRFQVRIDGVDDMTAIGICTDADVNGVINEIRFESPVDDTYIDDIVVREDQWCGTGGVYVVVPTAAGTVEEWTGAYTDVDDLPPSFTDYIEGTSGAGSDQLFRHGGLAGDYDINIVGVFAKGRLTAAADEVFYALARSVTTDDTGDAQVLDTTGVYARVLLTADPHGNIAWTTHAVNNALQIGIEA